MRDYELLYILRPDLEDEQVAAIQSRIRSRIEELGGAVEKVDDWGRRRMAYEIKGYRDGHYTLIHFRLPPDARGGLEHTLRLTDGIMRHLITRRERQPANALAAQPATPSEAEPEAEAEPAGSEAQ